MSEIIEIIKDELVLEINQIGIQGPPGNGSLSNETPQNLGVAASGDSVEASRSDHVHNVPTKTQVGLGNVDNTADVDKPISAATQTALDAKAAKGENSDITSLSGLTTALSISQGGTGATTVAAARTALGINNIEAQVISVIAGAPLLGG